MQNPLEIKTDSSSLVPNPAESIDSKSKDNVNSEQKKIEDVTQPVLQGNDRVVYDSSSLQQTVDSHPPATGMVSRLVKTFSRLFSAPTLAEKNTAQTIQESIKQLEAEIKKLKEITHEKRRAEKKNAKNRPAAEALQITKDLFDKDKAQLIITQNHLVNLKKHTAQAKLLANKYSTYNHLPEELSKLEEKVQHFSNRLIIVESLYDLEKVMSDYLDPNHPVLTYQDEWKKFKEIQTEKKKFADNLVNLIKLSEIEKDKKVKKIVDQSTLTPSNMKKIIDYAYPSLSDYAQRIFGYSSAINQSRIEILKQKSKMIEKLISTYQEQTKNISNLQKKRFSRSFVYRFYRIFINKNKLNVQLEAVEEQQKKLFADMSQQRNDLLNIKEELEWLDKMSKSSESYTELSKKLNLFEQTYTNIEQQQKAANHLKQLNKLLEQKRSFQYFNPLTLTQLINKNEKAIKEELMALSSILQTQSIKLPSNFNKLTESKKLFIQISTAFPTLKHQANKTQMLIKKQSLNLNDVLNSTRHSLVNSNDQTGLILVEEVENEELIEEENENSTLKKILPEKDTIIEEFRTTNSDVPQPPPPPETRLENNTHSVALKPTKSNNRSDFLNQIHQGHVLRDVNKNDELRAQKKPILNTNLAKKLIAAKNNDTETAHIIENALQSALMEDKNNIAAQLREIINEIYTTSKEQSLWSLKITFATRAAKTTNDSDSDSENDLENWDD